VRTQRLHASADESFDRLVDLVYEAVVEPEGWETFLREVCRMFDARAPALLLDWLRAAVVITSRDGRVSYANAAAEELLRRGDVVTTVGGRIAAACPMGSDKLRTALRAAAQPGPRHAGWGTSVALPRSSQCRPVLVTVLPLPRRVSDLPGDAGTVLFIDDPERRLPDDGGWLREMFGLTCAEARVAARLADGLSLAEIADEAGVQVNSVRFHVKRVLQKTATRRQAELVRLLRDTANVRRDGGAEERPARGDR